MASRARNIYYRSLGVDFDGYAWLRNIDIPRHASDVRIGENAGLDVGVVLLCTGTSNGTKKITIGKNTYINRYTIVDASLEIVIGADVAIGPHCYITDHDHGFAPGSPVMEQQVVASKTLIGDGVWLGAHVIVLKGVTIGAGSIVGAGSVVTRSLPENIVAVGRPARLVKKR